MKLLELFSGTKSVSNAVGSQFNEIISVDILNKYNPTFVCNILEWDYKQYPEGYFDAIWASPPCTEYSIILNSRPERKRNIEFANSIVQRTLEIIQYFKPNKWFIENPQTGLLKNQSFMKNIPFYDIDYCMYSDFGYRKRTRIWTNKNTFNAKLCNKQCGNMIGNTHKYSTGNSYMGLKTKHQKDLYRIPEKLIQDLFGGEDGFQNKNMNIG
jgi:site-specific DNA-cytosine methylase